MKRLVFVAVAAIAGVGAAAPQASPPARPIAAGVTVGAIKVGGLSSEHARTRLAARFGMGLPLSVGDRSWVASPQRLGAAAAVDSAVSRALRAAPGTKVPLEVKVDRAAVRAYVSAAREAVPRSSGRGEARRPVRAAAEHRRGQARS